VAELLWTLADAAGGFSRATAVLLVVGAVGVALTVAGVFGIVKSRRLS
jgi:hypothetical protein